MKIRNHSLVSGRKAIRNALPYIQFFTDNNNNKLTLMCLERDHWTLTEKAMKIFQGYPISFGNYSGGEYSFVVICEILPMLIPQNYLPAVIKEVK